MKSPLTEEQIAALQRLRDTHTDEAFPPVLESLLEPPAPEWEGEHRLGLGANLTLKRNAGWVSVETYGDATMTGITFSSSNLDRAIELLQQARDWQKRQ